MSRPHGGPVSSHSELWSYEVNLTRRAEPDPLLIRALRAAAALSDP